MARRSIGNTFTINIIDEPVSVEAQYSPNKTTIHTTWQEGDIYMRTRESGGEWSAWQKIVGESGDETVFSFGISEKKTTKNASTPPSDISSWADAPMAVTDAKPYLWARVEQKSWDASTQSYVVDSTRYIRLTGEDGNTVEAQYAPNNNPTSSQIHTTWQTGDLYMRTKQSNQTTWSDWHKIVGENGSETDYSFNISKNKTSTNATTPPSDCRYSTWRDAPIAPTATYPYMWMKIQRKDGDGNNVGSASYVRLTGELGIDYEIRCPIDSIRIAADATSVSVTTTFSFFKKEVGNTAVAVELYYAVYYRNGSTYKLLSGASGQGTSVEITKTAKSTYEAFVCYVFESSYTGTEPHTQNYLARLELPILKNGDTGTGEKGDIGRFYYYAGNWSDFASTDTFEVSDVQAPYFSYTPSGGTLGYYVYNPDTNGTYTKSEMGTPSSNKPWTKMWDDFKYIITEAIFSKNAHLGSFIVSGDWEISQYGKIYDTSGVAHIIDDEHSWGSYTVSNAFTIFRSAYPSSSHPTKNNFVPTWAVDGKTGKAYMNDISIEGTISGVKSGKIAMTNDVNFYVNGTKFACFGYTDDEYKAMFHSRNDGGICIRAESYNSGGVGISALGNSGAKAMQTLGTCEHGLREGETFSIQTVSSSSGVVNAYFAPAACMRTASFTLPSAPVIGTMFICKGASSNLTVTTKSHPILQGDSSDILVPANSSHNFGRTSFMLFFMGSQWGLLYSA